MGIFMAFGGFPDSDADGSDGGSTFGTVFVGVKAIQRS